MSMYLSQNDFFSSFQYIVYSLINLYALHTIHSMVLFTLVFILFYIIKDFLIRCLRGKHLTVCCLRLFEHVASTYCKYYLLMLCCGNDKLLRHLSDALEYQFRGRRRHMRLLDALHIFLASCCTSSTSLTVSQLLESPNGGTCLWALSRINESRPGPPPSPPLPPSPSCTLSPEATSFPLSCTHNLSAASIFLCQSLSFLPKVTSIHIKCAKN